MSMTNHLPGNPFVEEYEFRGIIPSAGELANLALAWEQRQRNLIAYRTAKNRGIDLTGLEHLGGDDE